MPFLHTCLVILFWSSTWLVIKLQMGSGVSGEVSVAYRMALASAILCGWCFFRGHSLRYSKKDYAFIALQGFFNFGINYIFAYQASMYITSGVHAVVFSMLLPLNILNSALFFKNPIRLRTLLAALIGISGLCLVFKQELMGFNEGSSNAWLGAFWAFMGATMASFGNMAATRNQKAGIPVMQTNALGTAFGALTAFAIALAFGRSFSVQQAPVYFACLLHLAIIGTICAFGSYFSLVKLVGASKASYTSIVIPVTALLISEIFEDFHWTPLSIAGICLLVLGNVLMLQSRTKTNPAVAAQANPLPAKDA